MTLRQLMSGACLVVLTATITTRVVSQEKEAEAVAPDWFALTQPGEAHERLRPMVGTWKQTVRMWQAPDTEPAMSGGKVTYQSIMAGRWLRGSYIGRVNDMPFTGMDITGYDNIRQEYVSVWIDNQSTACMLTRGRWNPETEAIEMTGTVDVPGGPSDVPVRTVTKVGESEATYEMFATGPDGKEFRTLEVTQRRISRSSSPR